MVGPVADELQRTLGDSVSVPGLGLFTGRPVKVRFVPAEPGAGIVFYRVDLSDAPAIPARVENVIERPRRTVLQAGDASVEMVEHCLSALAGLGVDNAIIEVDGPELPVGDGSASIFVDAIRSVGVDVQDAPRRPLVITEPVTVREGDAMVAAFPSDTPDTELMYVLDYGPKSPIGRQIHTLTLTPETYIDQIARARTFSTVADAERAWEQGMFRHLSPREMLVIGEDGPVENAYRFDGEPVKHKLLDLLGDLALLGRPIHGRIVAVRSGHALNHRLTRELVGLCDRESPRPALPRPAMDIRSILRVLPHRYPMILIDRVLEIEEDRRAVGIKNVTINEPFFQGHYPGEPIMPGVLIVEAMCQLSGLMLSRTLERAGKIALLVSLDGVRLRRAVTPGDQLVLETESLRSSPRFGEVQGRGFVGGELVAEARVKFMMVDAGLPASAR